MKPLMRATLLSALTISLNIPALAQEEVNVYSYRQQALIQPMLDAFTSDTGIKVNIVHAKKGLLERLKHEGKNTPADLIFTVDIGTLSDIKNAGLTQATDLADAVNAIPSSQRDPENHWFGLTQHARILVASKDRVKVNEISSYADLANTSMDGRVCTRSGKHPYMVALTAGMIAHHGEAEAEKWLAGVKNNLARKPQGNDRAQVKAISQGECDVAVINHYYMAKMLADSEQIAWANSVNVIFPDQNGAGTHMNISGMAMTQHAKNTEAAIKLMAFLASPAAQKMYSNINGEYPVLESIEWSDQLKQWGTFKRDQINLEDVAANRAAAIKMTDRVGYDH